jgi:hypothetical protein
MVVLSGLAKAAMAAWAGGRDGDSLAFFYPTHLGATTVHNTRYFVPQRNGLLDAHGAKTAVLIVVKI